MTSQRQEVLEMLRSAGARGVTNVQFLDAYIPRFGGRIHELREQGYEITSTTLDGPERWVYTLVSEPATAGAPPGTSSRQSLRPGPADGGSPPPGRTRVAAGATVRLAGGAHPALARTGRRMNLLAGTPPTRPACQRSETAGRPVKTDPPAAPPPALRKAAA